MRMTTFPTAAAPLCHGAAAWMQTRLQTPTCYCSREGIDDLWILKDATLYMHSTEANMSAAVATVTANVIMWTEPCKFKM
jgi:hypothetical protein